MKESVKSAIKAAKNSVKKLQRTFDGDSNDAEHDAAIGLIDELKKLFAELEAEPTPTEAKRHAAVRELAEPLTSEGDLEMDDEALVSEGDDNGAYVQMWKWVPFDGTKLCKDDEHCNECEAHG